MSLSFERVWVEGKPKGKPTHLEGPIPNLRRTYMSVVSFLKCRPKGSHQNLSWGSSFDSQPHPFHRPCFSRTASLSRCVEKKNNCTDWGKALAGSAFAGSSQRLRLYFEQAPGKKLQIGHLGKYSWSFRVSPYTRPLYDR